MVQRPLPGGSCYWFTFEYHNSRQIDNLCIEELVQGAASWLQRSNRDQISGAIPPDVVESVELRRDLWDSDGNYCGVNGHQKGTQEE